MRDLTVAYDAGPVLTDLNLRVAKDEVVAVLGPSGSGKSTLLSAVAGFLRPTAGEIRIDGHVAADQRHSLPPEAREVAVVFQQHALWPHMTAREIVAYPLLRRGVDPSAAREQASGLLERLGLADLAARRPAQLSGGEQQRVGLARALARGASLYLFDEPTANLDTPLRAALADEIASRRREAGAAALYATHDAGEALAVADRVALLRDGRLTQLGTPREIYEEPVDVWAARLTGPASLLTAPVEWADRSSVVFRVDGLAIRVPAGSASLRGTGGKLLVRPDWTTLGGPLTGVVGHVAYRGALTDYRLRTSAGEVHVRQAGPPTAALGDTVTWTLHRAWVVGVEQVVGPAGIEPATKRL